MDFIERWLHLSPDNGSGTTEALFLLVAAVLFIALTCRRRIIAFVKRAGRDD